MTEHEKRIREALEAGPTEGPFITFNDQVYRANDPDLTAPVASWNTSQFTMEGVSIDALYYAACNPAAIRALLADLDAVRVKAARYDYLSERLVGADFDWNESGTQVLVFKVEPGTQVWATADETIDGAIAALKGATA